MASKLRVEVIEVANMQISNKIYEDYKANIEKKFTVLLKQLSLRWIITGEQLNCILAKQEIARCAMELQ